MSCNCLSYPGLTEGELRLSNGLIPQEGTVEVCVGGTWRGVCDWDYTDAYVACRQMGFPATGIYTVNVASVNHQIMIVDCYGPLPLLHSFRPPLCSVRCYVQLAIVPR